MLKCTNVKYAPMVHPLSRAAPAQIDHNKEERSRSGGRTF